MSDPLKVSDNLVPDIAKTIADVRTALADGKLSVTEVLTLVADLVAVARDFTG